MSGSFATIVWRWERSNHREHSPYFWVTYVLAAIVGSVYLGTREGRPLHAAVSIRADHDLPSVQPTAKVGHPYRSTIGCTMALAASPLSGIWTSAILLACMIGIALAVPGLLHLQRWVEAEWVVVVWWLLWSTLLTCLLYRGWRLSDDHVLARPRALWSPGSESTSDPGVAGDLYRGGCDPTLGCADAVGCGEATLAVLLVGLILTAAWLVVEFVLPSMFFIAYILVRTSVARIANDNHGCEQRIGRSLLWGLLWASLYALPLATIIYVVHQFVRYS